MQNVKKKILTVDLNATSPVYTAYLNDALNRIGFEAVISGVNRNVRGDLDTPYISTVDRSQYLSNGVVKKLLRFVEYLLNWINTVRIAHKFYAIHIQWLPLLQYNNIDLFFLNRLLSTNSNVIYEVHNILPHDVSSKKIENRFRKLYLMMPKLIVHTQKSKHDLITKFGITAEKITVMPLGPLYREWVDEKPTHDINIKMMGMIGVIRSYKGVEDAIEVLHNLSEKYDEICLLIAGKGPSDYLTHLDNRIAKYKLEKKVNRIYRFLSESEMISLYKQCRVILAPYKDIDQSGAVTTALSLGIPVVGYKVGGLPELVNNDINGELVTPGDIHQLSIAVERLLEKDAVLLHKNCLRSMEHCSWENNAQILKDCYASS